MLQNNSKLLVAYNHREFSFSALEVCHGLAGQDWAQVDSSSWTE